MVNKKEAIGILIMILVFGISVIGYSDDTTESNGNGGVFTLTGIPAEYNGKYALMWGYDGDGRTAVDGGEYHPGTTSWTGILISNRSAIIPVRLEQADNYDNPFVEYYGNDTYDINVVILIEDEYWGDNALVKRNFTSVKFTSGNASVEWSSGVDN